MFDRSAAKPMPPRLRLVETPSQAALPVALAVDAAARPRLAHRLEALARVAGVPLALDGETAPAGLSSLFSGRGAGTAVFAAGVRCAPHGLRSIADGALLARAPSGGLLQQYYHAPHPAASRGARHADTLLISLADGLLHDEAGVVDGVSQRTLDRVFAVLARQGRNRAAIMVPADARNAVVRSLLRRPRAAAPVTDVLALDEGVRALIRQPHHWDALVVLADDRPVLAAVLGETLGVAGDAPFEWVGRDRALFGVETGDAGQGHGCPIAEGLALAALLAHAERPFAARRLYLALAALLDRGIRSESQGAVHPYARVLPEEALLGALAAVAGTVPREHGRWMRLGLAGDTVGLGVAKRALRVHG